MGQPLRNQRSSKVSAGTTVLRAKAFIYLSDIIDIILAHSAIDENVKNSTSKIALLDCIFGSVEKNDSKCEMLLNF